MAMAAGDFLGRGSIYFDPGAAFFYFSQEGSIGRLFPYSYAAGSTRILIQNNEK